ncbi:MAG: cytochrome c [Anaerolineaceae bacterium]|nr:cytochrome c [Anaerolineaceae bacterium]
MSLYKFPQFMRSQSRWLGLVLVLLLASCGGLSGEPAIVATIPPQPTPIPEPAFPQTAPDIALGASLFAENCTRCHGVGGRGDGSLIGPGADQVPTVPPDFTDPATIQNLTPADWFQVITNGRMDVLMPPWKDKLTADQRWAVALYTYTLSYSPDQLASGAVLFDQFRDSASSLISDQELLAGLTDTQLAERLNSDLPSEDQLAVARFIRASSLANADEIGTQVASEPAATPEVVTGDTGTGEPASTAEVSGPVNGDVVGIVTNGTTGGELPDGLTITLHMLDMNGNEDTFETTMSPDGGFIFPGVELRDDRGYYVSTVYHDIPFLSDLNFGDPSIGTLDLSFSIYETTHEATSILITGIVIQISGDVTGLQVAQIIRFENLSDKVFITEDAVAENQFASVHLTLPAGAQNVDTGQPDRFIISGNPATVTDTEPLIPGAQHIFHAIYNLSYDGHLTLEQPFDYPIDGTVQVLITPSSLQVTSDQLTQLDPQDVSGTTYDRYGASLLTNPGDMLRFVIDGTTDSAATSSTSTTTTGTVVSTTPSWLPIALLVIGVSVIGLGVFFYWRDRKSVNAQNSLYVKQVQEALLEQIAELDRAYEAGEIKKKSYNKMRDQLKERLAEVMKD